MPSQRLEQIQAAIQKLTDAKKTGLADEIVAAQALLSAPLPQDLTPQQALETGKARLDRFGQVVKSQEEIANWAKAAADGMKVTIANLERPDRLAIPLEEIDANIDNALGIAAQATKLFIDPETGAVIAGRKAGELKSGQQLNLAKLLAEEGAPISQENLAEGIFGRKGKEKSGDVRSLVAKLNRGAEDQGLPPVVVNPGRKGYGLGLEYEILGIQPAEPAAPTVPVKTPVQAGRPESYSISQVLAMEGIAGVLSETQTRRLTQELLARGHLRVGEEVMEGRAQARGASSKIVRDLELTSAGVEIMRDVTNQFGAQSRIQTNDVVNWLSGQKGYPVALIPQKKDDEKPYGQNGPSVLTSEHERIILDRLKRCELGIEQRLGKSLGEKFKIERDHRLGELTDRLAEDESFRIDADTQYRIRREAAATILELSKDARSFNFVRKRHPGLELALLIVKALDEKSVSELAEAMVNPPQKVADTIDRNGVVNGIRTVGSMGDK